jgi:hypothetical protein
MIDNIHFLEERPQLGAVTHIPAREMDVGREYLWIARGQIVQPSNLVSFAGEMVGKRRAEKSRGSRDQKIHWGITPFVITNVLQLMFFILFQMSFVE